MDLAMTALTDEQLNEILVDEEKAVDELRRWQRHSLLRQYDESGRIPAANLALSEYLDTALDASALRRSTIAMLRAEMAQAERKGMEKANALAHLVKSYQLADTELRRANDAGTQPRMQRAGNRIFMTRSRMFKAAQAIRDMAGGVG